MPEEKKEIKEIKKVEKNVLENGTYSIFGPDNGDISFDTLELHSGAGNTRRWKIVEFSREKIVFKVEKF